MSAERDGDPLVARLKAGDAAAFDAAYEQYHRRLYGFLARLTGRRDLAQDLLQETYMRLATHAPDLRDDTRLEAWLYTVARNLSLSFLRWRVLDRQRQATLRGGAGGPQGRGDASPFELTAAAELQRRLEEGVAELPVRYREVLLLVAVDGLEPQVAAQVLGLRPEALRQRLLRARDMLKRLVERAAAPAARTEAE